MTTPLMLAATITTLQEKANGLVVQGWLQPQIHDRRAGKGLGADDPDGTHIKSVCLVHCYRGGVFSGVLWSAWERTITRDDLQIESPQRWIECDLLRHQRDYGWGYKDMEESMHPYFYSCPLGYLDLVPIDQYGGNEEWRNNVRSYHARITEKRRARKAAWNR